MTIVEDFITASDTAVEYSDNQIAKLEQQALEDIDGHFRGYDRDVDLWQELGVPPELTIKDYEIEDIDDRDLEWALGLAGIGAASSTQFLLDNRDETIIKPVAYREQVLAGFALSRSQLIQAGKRSVTIVTEAKYVALQTRYVKDLAFLAEMDSVTLYNTLLEYDAILPADKLIANQMGYVSRMTNYQPGSPQWKEAVSNLIDVNSKGNLNQMNRRAVQQVYTYRETDGDFNTELVWIVEGGPNTCQYCLDRAGEIMTYREWIDQGLPGSDVCAGGDRCRCQLAAV